MPSDYHIDPETKAIPMLPLRLEMITVIIESGVNPHFYKTTNTVDRTTTTNTSVKDNNYYSWNSCK